ERLRIFAEEMMEEHRSRLDDVCHILVSNRDRREEQHRQSTLGERVKKYFTFFDDRENVE
ncbi:MAG TPA: phospholipase, partial [Micavibrio sp.]